MEDVRNVLGTVDYIVFGSMLVISSGIGVYFRFSGGKQKTSEEYLLAGRDMPVLPVAFSLMASFLSAITTIGIPAEIYRFGFHMTYLFVGYALGMLLAVALTTPVYYQLQASSAYEYLDRRYGTTARTLTSAAFVIQSVLYMAVVLYAPALALSAVTDMSLWVAIVSIGVVCTFYCTLGGMKAVLWTDLFQGVLMYIGIFAVLIKGLVDMGASTIYKTAYEGGRLGFPSSELNMTVRYTVWGTLFHGTIFSFISYAGNQIQIQRLMTVKSLSRAKLAVYISIPMVCSLHVLSCIAGVIIFSYFATCDPIESGKLSASDQLMPYYMMKTLSEYPGVPGLCICGVFSASLSTVSSSVNSLTAVTMQDFIRPCLESRGKSIDSMVTGAKILSLFYGMLGVGLSFGVAAFGNLAQAGLSIYGIMGAPMLGILILGMVSTRANEKGVIMGLLAGLAAAAWVGFGSSSNGPPLTWLPVSTEGCLADNSTLNATLGTTPFTSTTIVPNLSSTEIPAVEEEIFLLYRVSFMWFSTIGIFTTLFVGYFSSLVFNHFSGADNYVPDDLISPLMLRLWKSKKELQIEKEFKAENNVIEMEKKPEPLSIIKLPDTKDSSDLVKRNGSFHQQTKYASKQGQLPFSYSEGRYTPKDITHTEKF